MPALIVNADDFGRSAGINRGILEAHARGIVTSTTVMINYEDAPAGLEQALEEAPDLRLGLHLTLTSGRPVSPPETVPSLVDADGHFFPVEKLSEAASCWTADDLRRELQAQVDRFVALVGRPPTHLDSHHHATYLHPEALRVMLALAAAYEFPIRNPGAALEPVGTADRVKQMLVGVSDEQAYHLAESLHHVLGESQGVRWPDHLETRFFGPRAILGELLVILTTLPADGVTELMCHPGYAAGLVGSSYVAERERELHALTHASTHEVISAENIRLMTFAELTD